MNEACECGHPAELTAECHFWHCEKCIRACLAVAVRSQSERAVTLPTALTDAGGLPEVTIVAEEPTDG